MWWRVITGKFWQVTSPAWGRLYGSEFWAAAHVATIGRRWSMTVLVSAGEGWAASAARRLRKLSGKGAA